MQQNSLLEISQLLEPSFDRLEAEADRLEGEVFPRKLLQQILQTGCCQLYNPSNWQEVPPGQPAQDIAPPDELRRLRFEMMERLASACGTAQLLVGQHVSAVSLLSVSRNLELVEKTLPSWESGEKLCGVGFSHLGRMLQNPDPQAAGVTVTVGEKYYFLSGEIPWVSGWGLFDDYIVGGYATSPVSTHALDSRLLYLVVPSSDPAFEAVGGPAQAAMNASRTVTLRFSELKVPKDRWVVLLSMEELRRSQSVSILRFAVASLGIVRAACKLFPTRESAWAQLYLNQAKAVREKILGRHWNNPAHYQEALQVRAAANILALHAAQAAMMLAGGVANDADHPSQRLLREASFHFVFATPSYVRKAMLAQLAEAFPPDLELDP